MSTKKQGYSYIEHPFEWNLSIFFETNLLPFQTFSSEVINNDSLNIKMEKEKSLFWRTNVNIMVFEAFAKIAVINSVRSMVE